MSELFQKVKRSLIVLLSMVYWGTCSVTARVQRLMAVRQRPRCFVLYYHGVSDAQRARFRRQVAHLQSNASVVPLADGCQWTQANRHVGLTFDDGLASVAKNVVPVLMEYRLPATLFVVSGRLGQRVSWKTEPGCEESGQRLLTRRALCRLPYPQFDVGSHTVTHVDLAKADTQRATQELTRSKEQLEALLGRPVRSVSFPYGNYDKRVVQLARHAGYARIVTCEPRGSTSSNGVIGRFRTSPDDWMIEFRLKVVGAYSWLYYAQRMKRAGCRLLQCMRPLRKRSRTHVPASAA